MSNINNTAYNSLGSSKIALRSHLVDQPVKSETAKQLSKLQQGEIEELRNSLRYAEFILQRTRQEKAEVEAELQRHDERVQLVHKEVEAKEEQAN